MKHSRHISKTLTSIKPIQERQLLSSSKQDLSLKGREWRKTVWANRLESLEKTQEGELMPLNEETKSLRLTELLWMSNSRTVIKTRDSTKTKSKRSDSSNSIRNTLTNRIKTLSSNCQRLETPN